MLSKQLRLYAGKKETVHITVAILITDLVKALRQAIYFINLIQQGNTLKSPYVMVPGFSLSWTRYQQYLFGFADICIFDEGLKFQRNGGFVCSLLLI